MKGAVELLGLKILMEEAGWPSGATLEGDSAACKGILARQGCGRIKHLEVRQLWLQSYIKDDRLGFKKICRTVNPADSLAKAWNKDGDSHFLSVGFRQV